MPASERAERLLEGHGRVSGTGTSLTNVPPGPALSPDALDVLETVACGLLQTTTNGTILRANRLFCAWIGQPAEALIGRRRFQDLLTIGGRIFHQTHWAPLLQMQGSLSEVKLELVHTDGSTIPIVINALAREHNGTRVHELAAFVARDRDKYERELVSSRKRLEDAVAEATRLQADAKDRAVFAEQMIGIVSHDLRNPLSAIQMGAAVLERGPLTEPQQRTLARITRATERARHLIADLLDFTQARLGKGLQVSVAPLDLHVCVAEAVEDLSLSYPARLKHERSGSGECVADGNRLAQLIGNLVSNAVAYGTAGEPVIVRSDVSGETLSIEVHNRGVPIAAEAQTRLFKPMTRGTAHANPARSVGLGLYIVNEIARAHAGYAAVTSSSEDGTTFRVVFPRLASTTTI